MKKELFELRYKNVVYIREIRENWKYAKWKFKNNAEIIIGSQLWNDLESEYENKSSNFVNNVDSRNTEKELKDEYQDCLKSFKIFPSNHNRQKAKEARKKLAEFLGIDESEL